MGRVNRGMGIHRLALALIVALVAALGIVAVGTAAGAARRPPCTRQALSAGLRRGPERVTVGKIARPWGCSGSFAYSAVLFTRFEGTALFRAQNGRWVTANRSRYCRGHQVPRRIYKPACLSN